MRSDWMTGFFSWSLNGSAASRRTFPAGRSASCSSTCSERWWSGKGRGTIGTPRSARLRNSSAPPVQLGSPVNFKSAIRKNKCGNVQSVSGGKLKHLVMQPDESHSRTQPHTFNHMAGKSMKSAEHNWQRIPWDGNPELGYYCWRKRFGKGHVSVGIGDFLHVGFSYGADSDDSFSSTRWTGPSTPPLTEEEAMRRVDLNGGKSLLP